MELIRSSAGVYFSEDGRWNLQAEKAYTLCENPHPQGRGKPYCFGGKEHAYSFWQLSQLINGHWQKVDAGPTMRMLAQSIPDEP